MRDSLRQPFGSDEPSATSANRRIGRKSCDQRPNTLDRSRQCLARSLSGGTRNGRLRIVFHLNDTEHAVDAFPRTVGCD